MIRKIILVVVVLVVLGGLYVSRGTFETVTAMALTARDLFFPDDESATGHADGGPPANVMATRFANSLMVLDDGVPKSYEPSKLTGVKYWAFYYSSSSDPASRDEAEYVASFYLTFKYWHPNFELIYVSLDRSSDDMLTFMKTKGMTFPAIWFADINDANLEAMKYYRGAMPALVLVDDQGNVLADGYMRPGSEMMTQIRSIVP